VVATRAYPHDLASRVRASWPPGASPLPRLLDDILDAAYHASFLRDEARPVTCRLIAVSPDTLPTDDGPPSGLLPLAFESARPFDEGELRGLSPAAHYHRALIGIHEVDDRLQIWGMIQSGPRWLQSAHGGHAIAPPMPQALVVNIVRPGHLTVACGATTIAELHGGALTDFTLDVFTSTWLGAKLSQQADDGHAAEVARVVAQQMVRRVIATMRKAHHGGAVVIVSPECRADRFLHAKYAFRDDEPRRRFRRLVVAILEHTIADPETALTRGHLDEALFELSSLIAALADVDGAVVLTRRFEILGFGAEIAGDLPVISEVRRGLDLEADRYTTEIADGVGTRHRSAYRLCAAEPSAIAIVVSQDGAVRFVTSHRGAVTYWEHGTGDG
jgi:hypothetical protein